MGSSAMLDLVGSMLMFAVLIFTVGRVQVNLNSTMYHNTIMYGTQSHTLALSKQIEFDFHKIGFRVPNGTMKVEHADTNTITFRYVIRDDPAQTLRTITYRLDPDTTTGPARLTQNPNDIAFLRTENGTTITQNIGLTQFNLRYYDADMNLIPTPITGTWRDSIRAINVFCRIESLEPVIMPDATRYISVIWEKLIYPRNLGNLR
jgi:hypothetical protein